MNHKFIAALVVLGMTGAASAADVDFDKGVDVSNVIKQASSVETPAVGKATRDPGQWDGHHDWDGNNWHGYPGPAPHHVRYSRDCHTFNFGPAGGPVLSELAYLQSTEYVQECHYVPDPPPPPPNPQPGPHPQPGPQPGPQPFPGPHPHPGPQPFPGPHPGPFPGPNGPHGPKSADGIDVSALQNDSKGMQCNEIPGDNFRRTVQVNMEARQLLPWESDSFEACMEGPNVEIHPLSTAYSYGIAQSGGYDVRYELTTQYKLTTAPDPNGLNAAGFSYANGKFTFNVSERWANEYAGNKVAIDVQLYKDGFWFFDAYKGKKEFTFDTAGSYSMTFAENELDTSKAVATPETRGGSKYFLKWSFHRIGNVSTGDSVNKGSTDKIQVN